jgi:hypothetical protein
MPALIGGHYDLAVPLTATRRVGNSRTFLVVFFIIYWVFIGLFAASAIATLVVRTNSGASEITAGSFSVLLGVGLAWLSLRHLRRCATWDDVGLHIRGTFHNYTVVWSDVHELLSTDTVIRNAGGSGTAGATYALTGTAMQVWNFSTCTIGFTDGGKNVEVVVSSSYRSSQQVLLTLLAALPLTHPLRAGLPEPYRSATKFTVPAADPHTVASAAVQQRLRMPIYLPVIYFLVEGLFAVIIGPGWASAQQSSTAEGDTYPFLGWIAGAILFGIPLAVLLWCMIRIWFVSIELTAAGLAVHRVWGRVLYLPGEWILGFTAVQINGGSNVLMHTAQGTTHNLLVGAGIGDRAFGQADLLNDWLTKTSHPPRLAAAITDKKPETDSTGAAADPADPTWEPVVNHNAPPTSHRAKT